MPCLLCFDSDACHCMQTVGSGLGLLEELTDKNN